MASAPAKRKYPRKGREVAPGSNQRRIGRPEVTKSTLPLYLGKLFDTLSIDLVAQRTASHVARYGCCVLEIDSEHGVYLYVEGTPSQEAVMKERFEYCVVLFRPRSVSNPLLGRKESVEWIRDCILDHLHDLRAKRSESTPRAA